MLETNDFQEETNIYVKAEILLDHMYRRSDEDFARFRAALRNVGQEHVIRKYLEQLSTSVPESGSVDESTSSALDIVSAEECEPAMERITGASDEMEVERPTEEVTLPLQDQSECCSLTQQTFVTYVQMVQRGVSWS